MAKVKSEYLYMQQVEEQKQDKFDNEPCLKNKQKIKKKKERFK